MLARIYRPARTAMQSGKAGSRQWLLEFEPGVRPPPEMLMGWTSSADTTEQVRLSFETKEQAIAFARRCGVAHRVIEPQETKRIIKAYGDNFSYRRKEPWSH